MIRALIMCAILFIYFLPAFSLPFNDLLLTGTWKGTSLCQVKNSPCNDETAVYHISKTAKPGIYRFIINKMVDGKETDMGILEFIYNPFKNTCTNKDEQRQMLWTFTIKNKMLEGTNISNSLKFCKVITLTFLCIV